MKKLIMLSLMMVLVDADIVNLSVSQENSSKNSQVERSHVTQGEVNILDSTVDTLVVGSVGNTNRSKIENSFIMDSDVFQNSVDIDDSRVLSTNFFSDSEISDNTHIENNSTVIQGALKAYNKAEITNSTFTLSSKIQNASIRNSTLSQNEMSINNKATVASVTMTGTHTIHDNTGVVNIVNSTVTQGKLSVVENSTLKNSTINMESSIDESIINDSSVDLCSVYVRNGVIVEGVTINGVCTMQGATITGATVVQGSVVIYQ
jgi:hypothetical protein